jgi:CheY-like chemotaxis protein
MAAAGCNDFEWTIHLLLADVVMPEMSGPELADQMALLRPGIKMIFTSGYTDDAIARQTPQFENGWLHQILNMKGTPNETQDIDCGR